MLCVFSGAAVVVPVVAPHFKAFALRPIASAAKYKLPRAREATAMFPTVLSATTAAAVLAAVPMIGSWCNCVRAQPAPLSKKGFQVCLNGRSVMNVLTTILMDGWTVK